MSGPIDRVLLRRQIVQVMFDTPECPDGHDGRACRYCEADAVLAAMEGLIRLAERPEPEFHVRRKAPDTSKAIEGRVADGTFQRQVLDLFIKHHRTGLTDYDLEVLTDRSHQSVSATRNTLYRKGRIVDSGERRTNKFHNRCIVWKVTP